MRTERRAGALGAGAPERGTEPLLAVRGLTKRYGAEWALRDAAFDVLAGEVLGLIGPNGAGKTTLFECLAGLLAADGGSVAWEGRPLTPRERSRHVFYLPDGITPWGEQLVGEVLRFFARLSGGRLLPEVAEALGVAPLVARRLSGLSKGERKRVVLALGLSAPQPLLLLDEPFDGLDLRQTREAAALLRSESARGRTLFLSIHQLVDAARVCDRFVLLSGGREAGTGDLASLRERAALPEGSLEEVFLALT